MGMPVITPSTTTREQAITDIIASVALQEAGLSHIINAEGEKIQKIVAVSSDPAELLAVNKSVESMISTITQFEMLLKAKLAVAYEFTQN